MGKENITSLGKEEDESNKKIRSFRTKKPLGVLLAYSTVSSIISFITLIASATSDTFMPMITSATINNAASLLSLITGGIAYLDNLNNHEISKKNSYISNMPEDKRKRLISATLAFSLLTSGSSFLATRKAISARDNFTTIGKLDSIHKTESRDKFDAAIDKNVFMSKETKEYIRELYTYFYNADINWKQLILFISSLSIKHTPNNELNYGSKYDPKNNQLVVTDENYYGYKVQQCIINETGSLPNKTLCDGTVSLIIYDFCSNKETFPYNSKNIRTMSSVMMFSEVFGIDNWLKAFNNNNIELIYDEAIKLYGTKEDAIKLFELYDIFFEAIDNYDGKDSQHIYDKWDEFQELFMKYLNSEKLHNQNDIKEQVSYCFYRIFDPTEYPIVKPYFNETNRMTYEMLRYQNLNNSRGI